MTQQLTDGFSRPHTYLRIAVTERCNLRCSYCMPAEGIPLRERTEMLTFDEIVRFATVCAGLGVTKIRLTGGEPLVRRDLPTLVARLNDIEGITQVCMTTNGTLLSEHVSALREAGLQAVNISLDTLRSGRFERITRRNDHAAVLRGIESALYAGFSSVKINTVVIKGVNDDELKDFVEFARYRMLQVRFIEYMPFASNAWSEDGFISGDVLRTRLADQYTLRPMTETAGASVSRNYDIEGFRGSIGFISSMSEHFCGQCDRVRLTADGALKACLFSNGERDMRELLRGDASDEEIAGAVRAALSLKWEAHPGPEQLQRLHNRSMIRIGG